MDKIDSALLSADSNLDSLVLEYSRAKQAERMDATTVLNDAVEYLKNHENELTKEFSDNGIVLSGGEIQKLAIARILDGEFGLLLFDEPSSALDPIAEEQVMKLIYSMASTTTTIVIAHRLSSIRDMDRILVVDNGRIIEEGNHNQLMNRKGLYYQMWNTQAEKYK